MRKKFLCAFAMSLLAAGSATAADLNLVTVIGNAGKLEVLNIPPFGDVSAKLWVFDWTPEPSSLPLRCTSPLCFSPDDLFACSFTTATASAPGEPSGSTIKTYACPVPVDFNAGACLSILGHLTVDGDGHLVGVIDRLDTGIVSLLGTCTDKS